MASRGHKESNGSGKLHDDNVNKIIIILQNARTNPVEKYSIVSVVLVLLMGAINQQQRCTSPRVARKIQSKQEKP